MKSRWDDEAAGAWADDLDEAVYGTRAIGGHDDLVLHGGGNSSLKSTTIDVTGREIDVMYVKGSGWDMGSIERPGLTPLRLPRVRELLAVDDISDPVLVNELRCASIDSAAPDASIEAPLHALLPHRAVLHSHADAIVALTDQPDAAERVRDLFGSDVVVVDYVKPGFRLAQACAAAWQEQSTQRTRAMVLLKHGLFTFGATMKEAYEAHIAAISRVESALDWRPSDPRPSDDPLDEDEASEFAVLRRDVSRAAERPFIAVRRDTTASRGFIADGGLVAATQRGTATPDHVIRTKPNPMIGRDVQGFVTAYVEYFERNAERHDGLQMLDPAPRHALDQRWGSVCFGKTAKEAHQVADIAAHTFDVITAAEAIGVYAPVSEAELFDVEYWDLEQAKLRRAGRPAPLTGQVAVVTGAASGIGRACVVELMAQGAAVVGIDVSGAVTTAFEGVGYRGIVADATDEAATGRALRDAVETFGGIDILVVAAGIFPESAPITDQTASSWARTIEVNATAVRTLFGQAHRYLRLSPVDARVVLIGSKNVSAPGPGAAAYSASKAAVTQLARVAALEWAADGIRVNIVHPDAVFDTALWTPALLDERAAKYGVSVEEYKRRNLLGTEVRSTTVASMVVAMCGDAFRATTGAQVPVDGGNDRVV